MATALINARNNDNDGPRYPDVTVQLVGRDGNAGSIIGAVTRALRHAGYGSQTHEYVDEAMSGDYDHLLRTTMRWVNVE